MLQPLRLFQRVTDNSCDELCNISIELLCGNLNVQQLMIQQFYFQSRRNTCGVHDEVPDGLNL